MRQADRVCRTSALAFVPYGTFVLHRVETGSSR